jgi:hypothetical protein
MSPGEHQHFIALANSLHLFVSQDEEARQRFARHAPGPNAVMPMACALPRLRDEEDYFLLKFVDMGALWDAVFLQAEDLSGEEGTGGSGSFAIGDEVRGLAACFYLMLKGKENIYGAFF